MKKGAIFGIIGAVVLILVIFVGMAAMKMGGEASNMDAMLKSDLSQHKAAADVKKQLQEAGYQMTGDVPEIKATGPKHSLIVYTTWLTLDLTFNTDGLLTGYHLDRAS